MAERIPMTMISGTNTFMILSNKKLVSPWVPFAPSGVSRFFCIPWMLVLNARSNLSAVTTSKAHDQILLLGFTSAMLPGLILHTMVFVHNACVKRGLILIFTPILVPGLSAKLVIALELYMFMFCSFRVQERNPGGRTVFTAVSHLFLNKISIPGLDHCAIRFPFTLLAPGNPGDSSIVISTPGTSAPIHMHDAYA